MTYSFTSTPFLFKHLKYFLFKNGVCFSQSKGLQFQKFSLVREKTVPIITAHLLNG